MDETLFTQYFLPVTISGCLIIGNEWIKEYLYKRHQRKKYKKWKEIWEITLKHGPGSVIVFEETDEIIYELLWEGMVEFDEIGNLMTKQTKLPERLDPRF